MISEETRTALAYADIDLPTATELEVQRLVESVGGTYVNEEEAMIHVRDALIRHTDLKLSDFDVHIDDDSTKLKDAINPTTATFAEVTFVLDGAPTTFTLGGIISGGTEAVVEATEPEFFVVEPASDAIDVTVPTEVQTARTLGEAALDVDVAETAEEAPVETVVVTEPVETAPETEVSSDELWLTTPATDYSVYPATDTVEIAAQTESLAVAA